MPAPGTLTRWHAPAGPGIRLDGGYDQGETVPGSFDSLVAKLIVTGRDRTQALERSRRALAEFVVDGMPTVIPFHLAVVDDPAFVGDDGEFGVHTSWIETEFDNQIPPYSGESEALRGRRARARHRRGRRPAARGRAARRVRRGRRRRSRCAEEAQARRGRSPAPPPAGTASPRPMQGTIVKVAVEEGAEVAEGDVIVVLEAMKMEQPLKAHKGGTVTGLSASGRRQRHQRCGGLRDQGLGLDCSTAGRVDA